MAVWEGIPLTRCSWGERVKVEIMRELTLGKGGGGCQGMAMSSRSEQLLLDTHPPENYPPLGQLPHP